MARAAEVPAPAPAANPSTTAYEELMSEHSVLRRVLYIYLRTAAWSEADRKIPLKALGGAASLFRRLGEEFHEAVLEEQHVFPQVRKHDPQVREMPDVLFAQHEVGRAITERILNVVASGSIAPAWRRPFAAMLREFVWMYQTHAAREDTILFPAWRRMLGDEFDDVSKEFDGLAKRHFGEDGFPDAVRTLESLEADFGMENLAGFTAQPPEQWPQ